MILRTHKICSMEQTRFIQPMKYTKCLRFIFACVIVIKSSKQLYLLSLSLIIIIIILFLKERVKCSAFIWLEWEYSFNTNISCIIYTCLELHTFYVERHNTNRFRFNISVNLLEDTQVSCVRVLCEE